MTVAELITMLQRLRPDAEVLITTECGCSDFSPTANIDVDQSDSDTMHFITADEIPRGTESCYYIYCKYVAADDG